MKNRVLISTVGIFSILIISVLCYCTSQDSVDTKIPTVYNNTLTSPYIPETVSFAGEDVPINIYWVYEALDRELVISCYQHSNTLMSFKRSGRFFPVIEKILAEEGLPADFKYLSIAESNLTNVVSPAKASGFWQFMEATGKKYGLEINDEVDERYHLEKSTRAACRYLKASKQRLGNWALAAAAYNMGEAGVKQQIEQQGCDNYWDLYLNQETSRYMYRILAYKLLFENPARYGIKLYKANLYFPVPCKEIKVSETIPDLAEFAKSHKITYRELKEMNPWLRKRTLTINNKVYTLKIPEKSKMSFRDLYKDETNPYQLIGDSVQTQN